MQYMLLIYEPAGAYQGEAGQRRLSDVVAKHWALAGELREKGIQLGGAGLQGVETATTVVTEAGQKMLHDGPFAETHEHLGGFYHVEVPDLDAALAIARRIPGVDGTKVEVRPLIERA
jgi:hypothetical protein